MLWSEVLRSGQLRGHWVALEHVRYSGGSAQPAEGDLVDSDEDLAILCARMRASDRSNCAVVFVDEAPSSSKLTALRRSS